MEPNQNLNNMKKNILILCAVLLFAACGQKTKTEQPQEQVQTEAANDYSHLNPVQDNGTTTVQEDLSGKVIILTADEFRTCCFGFFFLFALRKYQNSLGLACSMGQYDRTSDLLVRVSSVYAQFDVNFYCFIEFSL